MMAKDKQSAPSRWERRKEATRRRLLAAGHRLFGAHGFDATTVEEIALAADVAKGTFFNYFVSKEALLGELLYERTQSLLEAPPEGTDIPERIWRLLQAMRRELEPYVHLFQQMFTYALAHPLPDIPPKPHITPTHAIAQIVREGQAAATLRADVDAEVVGAMIATYFFRLCVLECTIEDGEVFCWEDRMRAALDVIYTGILVTE